jgi:hypothetical protein
MTDPTGLSFLSYRRARIEDASLLIAAQHDVGVPTWQDINNLGEGHTDAQLREILSENRIANAIAYLTPDVRESVVITKTELPGILKRAEAKDGFFAVPVAAGGLAYDQVTDVVGDYVGVHDLSQWNVLKVGSSPLGADDAALIARRVLRDRLMAIHRALPSDEPLRVSLHTRTPPAHVAGTALCLDWTHRFESREASQESWNDRLLPALKAVGRHIRSHAPGHLVVAEGFCALPAALALGATFLSTSGTDAGWSQYSARRPFQFWSLASAPEESGFALSISSADPSGDDVAVLVSVASDVEPAFAASRKDFPRFRAVLQIRPEGCFPRDIENAGQAVSIACQVAQGLRQVREQYQARGTIHLFLAIPAGLAFLIGQSLNTMGPVQTYEHIPIDGVGRYRLAALLRPSV